MTGPRSSGTGAVVAFFVMAVVVLVVMLVSYNSGIAAGKKAVQPCPVVTR